MHENAVRRATIAVVGSYGVGLTFGCAAGAHMVEHPGVVPGLPTRAELEARLAALIA